MLTNMKRLTLIVALSIVTIFSLSGCNSFDMPLSKEEALKVKEASIEKEFENEDNGGQTSYTLSISDKAMTKKEHVTDETEKSEEKAVQTEETSDDNKEKVTETKDHETNNQDSNNNKSEKQTTATPKTEQRDNENQTVAKSDTTTQTTSTKNSKSESKSETDKTNSNKTAKQKDDDKSNETTKEKQDEPSDSDTKQPTPKETVTYSIVISDTEIPLPPTEVEINEGDTVLDALIKITMEKKIQMDYRGGQGATAYVEGIDNLYEFDRGQGSGWMYRVNGIFPDRGAGVVPLLPGDRVEWLYTTNLGVDLGADLQPFRR